jgi:hypothetical protein
MDPRRLRSGELLALAGAVALAVLSFLPWYRSASGHLTAWDLFGLTDVLIVIAIVPALALAAASVFERSPAVPVALEVWTSVLALPACVAIAVRLLDKPDHATALQPASWLSLIAGLAVFAGGWQSLRDEHPDLYEPVEPEARPIPVPPPGLESPR